MEDSNKRFLKVTFRVKVELSTSVLLCEVMYL